jgi:multidrug efflux pump subunit AcrA (membrane-fusion protein)
VEFELSSGTDALVIERDAVRRYPDGTTTVWIVETRDDGDIAVEVPVTLGAMLGERVIVDGGLKPRARVVMRGGENLSPGQRVRVLTDSRQPADGP